MRHAIVTIESTLARIYTIYTEVGNKFHKENDSSVSRDEWPVDLDLVLDQVRNRVKEMCLTDWLVNLFVLINLRGSLIYMKHIWNSSEMVIDRLHFISTF